MNVSDALQTRISTNLFDTSATISDEEIATLVTLAQQAPSSFNIQFTRFIAVTDPELRTRLRAAAWGQPKVSEASVLFVLVGDLKAVDAFAERTRAAAAAGHMPADAAERVVGMAMGMYGDPNAAREEAARSAGLSGMSLMLAAQERGWVSGPMIGFDRAAFSSILGIGERYAPMMLVVVGKPAPGNIGRKNRLGTDAILRINSADF